jgi:hypothetical protein
MIRYEGIQFDVCKNPDVKCVIVLIGRSEIDCTSTLYIKITTDI